MALNYIGAMNVPNYTALSTDVVGNSIAGASRVGNLILLTDTGIWKVILDDLTLEDYALPISFNGSVDIGAVHLDQDITESIALTSTYGIQNVAVPGTAEPLVGSSIYALSMTVFAHSSNTGNVYLGNALVDKNTSTQLILTAGNYAIVDVPLGYKFGVHNWYVDADDAGNGVYFMYMN